MSWTISVLVFAAFSGIQGYSYPSTRRVYYLHTNPAAWSSARDTCAKYKGTLLTYTHPEVVNADIRVLDEILRDWGGSFQALTSDVWIGLYKYMEAGQVNMMWQGCLAQSPNDPAYADLAQSNTAYCMAMSKEYVTSPQVCSVKLPYICEIDAGQCWFWPLENKAFKSPGTVEQRTADLNTCAQLCRNSTLQTASDMQCWAFVVDPGDVCHLHFSQARHAFLLDISGNFRESQGEIVYLKVCAGGETTNMPPVTIDNTNTPTPEDCGSGGSQANGWLDSVCYCDCDLPPVILEPEDMVLTIDEKVEKIVEELKVNPSNLSSAQRKLSSAEDQRATAKGLGALGIAMLSLVFGGLILMDLNVVIAHILYVIQNGHIEPDATPDNKSHSTNS